MSTGEAGEVAGSDVASLGSLPAGGDLDPSAAAGRRWAWSLGSLSLLATSAGLSLIWLTRATTVPQDMETLSPAYFVGWLAFAAVGVLLVSRRPEHPIGWLLVATGLVWQITGICGAYRVAALLEHPTWPGGSWAAWGWEWGWVPGVVAVFLLPLLFPDGRPPSARWRWLTIGLPVAGVLVAASVALRAGPLPNTPAATNPLGVDAVGPVLDVLEGGGNLLLMVGSLLAFVAPVMRYRRATSVERQQLKWFAYAAGLVAVAWVGAQVLESRGADPALVGDVRLVPLMLLPLAIGAAVLRYRLYDIDRIISRTAVYLLLTITLVAVYAGSVVTLQGVLRPLTGSSDVAVVLSTLAVVALFQPARRRLQALVDRRFHRSRYDAQQVVAAYTSRLRDEVDLAAFESDLRHVVLAAVAPTQAWLWVPPDRGTGTSPGGSPTEGG